MLTETKDLKRWIAATEQRFAEFAEPRGGTSINENPPAPPHEGSGE